ncbi:MAG TPA: PEP-CTERM sorting domain-containing protein [Acidobacteriaceae bacterium]|nr:PEP-CTERM sorting domain-containing protein [Acidobacteriaceae bacterium]
MKFNLRLLPVAFAAIGLFVASSAKADTLNISIWAGGTTSNVPANNAAGNMGIYGTTPTITATVTNSDPTAILNFYSADDNDLTSFLTTSALGAHPGNGDTVTYLTGGNQHSTDGSAINNDLFQITGTVTLATQTYTYEHDDGMVLYLNGVAVINTPGPTGATPTSFNATAGTYSFVLDYAEVAGAPAVLQGNLPFTPATATPEPSSFMLLGSGLLGAAGVLRRRMKKA